MENKEIYEIDGIEEVEITDISELIPKRQPEIEDITDNIPISENTKKDYDLKRNGKKYWKTQHKYVYRTEKGEYVYRLFNRQNRIDTFVTKNSDTGKPFTREIDAYNYLRRDIDELEQGKQVKNANITFGKVWSLFLESNHGRANETIRRYDSIYKQHMEKVFGSRPINQIPTADYNDFFVQMHRVGDGKGAKKNGYSYAYVESFLKFVYLVVSFAFRKHFINGDTYRRFEDELKMPDKKKASDKKEIRVLSETEIKKIKDLLKDTDYYMPFLISLLGGTRPAETFALCFDDFDYSKNTVSINKQIVEEASGKLILKQPKTEKSTRVIELPNIVIEEVKRRERTLRDNAKKEPLLFEQNRGKVIDGRNFNEQVIEEPDFINRDSKGKYITAHSFSRKTKTIKESICPNDDKREDFSFYTFRKTHLSIMAGNNCPIGELMKRAGHGKVDTLYEYYYNRTETSESKLLEAMQKTAKLV